MSILKGAACVEFPPSGAGWHILLSGNVHIGATRFSGEEKLRVRSGVWE